MPFSKIPLAFLAAWREEEQKEVSRKDAKIAKEERCVVKVFLGVLGVLA